MSFFQNLIAEAIKSLLTDATTTNNSNLPLAQQNAQSENYAAAGTFDHDHAIFCKWCEITDIETRKRAIVDYLLGLDTVSYTAFQENLEQMKENVIGNIKQHEANEKFAWGRYIEDQIAYQNAKLRTGARDPKFMQVLNEYKLTLQTVSWTIQVCSEFWDVIKQL